jgi:phosphonopyruvate decarboxylase
MPNFSRFQVMKMAWDFFQNNSAYFTTTGYTSREFSLLSKSNTRFFPCVGGMGYVSSIGFSYAKSSGLKTICLDGDGSFLMQLGAIFNVKNHQNVPFLHILINNDMHQSVGGFEIAAKEIDYTLLSQAAGYAVSLQILTLDQLGAAFEKFDKNPVTTFLHIQVNSEVENNLPRVSGFTMLTERFLDSKNVQS